tara:strand:- start:239 stop:691 length:453 start_codon:yes stop_codon:yes gene_type:complete
VAKNSNSVWQILALQAKDEALRAEVSLKKTTQLKDKIIARQSKIADLLVEYSNHAAALQSDLVSVERDNCRKFIAQLMDLQNRTSHEYMNVESDFAKAKKHLILANQEKLKAEFLVKRDQEKQSQEMAANEKRELELQCIAQFNLRQTPP